MMNKMTFKQYLIEVDVGDLELAKQHADSNTTATQDEKAKNQFKQRMATSPAKGDLIQSNTGYYKVMNMSKQGTHVQQLKGDKKGILPHGTKFEVSGKSPLGQQIFKVS